MDGLHRSLGPDGDITPFLVHFGGRGVPQMAPLLVHFGRLGVQMPPFYVYLGGFGVQMAPFLVHFGGPGVPLGISGAQSTPKTPHPEKGRPI